MPAAHCPHCGRMVATVDGRRITHQIRFNEGWCTDHDSAQGPGRRPSSNHWDALAGDRQTLRPPSPSPASRAAIAGVGFQPGWV